MFLVVTCLLLIVICHNLFSDIFFFEICITHLHLYIPLIWSNQQGLNVKSVFHFQQVRAVKPDFIR